MPSGRVSFYNLLKRFGFVATDTGEVFIGRDAYYLNLWPDDEIEFDRVSEPGRRNDVAINVQLVARAPRDRGHVHFWSNDGRRGPHGYITLDRGGQVFVNEHTLEANGLDTLKVGDRVEVYCPPGLTIPSRIAKC